MTPRRALTILLGVLSLASAYRALHYALTGFFVPDEYGYFMNTWMYGKAFTQYFNLGYQDRYFFNGFNLAFFNLFQLNSIDRVVALLPIYYLLWAVIGVVSAYKTMSLLGIKDREVVLTLLLAITIPVYMLFSVTFLTEPVVFAMCMLGIYLLTRFRTRQDRWRQFYPPLAALAFAAAAYTRIDFAIFQLGGFLALLMPGLFRSRDLSLGRKIGLQAVPLFTYSLPTAFFSYFPGQIAQVTSSAAGTSAAAAAAGTFSSPLSFAVALVGGFNPVISGLVIFSLIFLIWTALRTRNLTSSLALLWAVLCLGIIAGITFIFYTSVGLPLSTAIRYGYDATPIYFLVAPFGLSRIRGKRKFGLMLVVILLYGALAASAFQGSLQSNLGAKYPFLSGDEQFLLPSYRTPLAQLRDYFSTLPSSTTINVVGDAELDQPCWPTICYHKVYNLTSDWKGTPGTARLDNVVFHGYVNASTLSNLRLTEFYLYVDRSDWNYFNSTNSYLMQIASGNSTATTNLPFKVTATDVIYNEYGFLLVRLNMSYQG